MPKHRSKVWDHFQKDDKQSKAYCRYCTSALVINNPSNLNKHLRCKHPLVYAAQKAKIDPDDPALTAIALESQNSEAQGQKNSDNRKSGVTLSQDAVVKSIIKFIAKDNIPVNVVDGEGFNEMMRDLAPNYSKVANKLFKAKLNHIYNVTVGRKKLEIQKVGGISLTASVWQKQYPQPMDFFDVKAYYITADHQVKSVLLACRPYQEDSIDIDQLKSIFDEILTEWGISTLKISCFVSDGTPLLMECGKILAPRRHFISFAHRLANTVISALEANHENDAQILDKVRTIVEIFNSIPRDQVIAIADRRGEKPIKLVQFVGTRFTSYYRMLESFLKNYENLGPIMIEFGYSFEITDEEKAFLEDCLLILKPFDLVAKELCDDKHPSLSKVIPISLCLRKKLDVVEPSTESGQHFKQICQEMINNKIGDPEQADIAAVATMLDPRFKNVDFQSSIHCKKATSIVNEHLISCSTNVNDKNDSSDKDLLWSHHDALASNRAMDSYPAVALHPSLKTYLEAPLSHRQADPLTVWQDIGFDRQLKSYALKHLCIPAAAVHPKTLFTKEGDIVTQRRNQMKPEQAQKLLFLNALSSDEFKTL
ncbi:E3 SUMO-protein ligase ZBED1-like [Brevipalpus obovatus]|uniref:E3 SUMO-protein ligase ZBED1-like n=1 Tax=Brevipalpus obovatus TaxID=246614 RepID=UPI003D9F99E8